MFSLLQTGLMVLSALLIATADTIIKKISISGVSTQALLSPLMFLVYFLYFIQIVITFYIFTHGGELAIYVNIYIIFYSILGVLSGLLIFNEMISLVQGIGIVLALTGVLLINFHQ